jgi:hypothetical protein
MTTRNLAASTLLACVIACAGIYAQTQTPAPPRTAQPTAGTTAQPATTVDPAIQSLVDQIKTLNDAAQKLVTPVTPPPPPPPPDPVLCADPTATNQGQPVPCTYPTPPPTPGTIHVPPTGNLQATIDAAPAGTTITLEQGATYPNITIPVKPGASATKRFTLTTKGFTLTGRPTPADEFKMATIQGISGTNSGIRVLGSYVDIIGVQLRHNLPSGQGEMISVGNASDPDLAHVPNDVRIMRSMFRGKPGNGAFGQKRAIEVTGRNVLVDQIWCSEIWIEGQDTQCVHTYSSPGPLTIRRSYLSAGAENILIGGNPPSGPGLVPADILIEDNILHKPLYWKTDGRKRQVKNLIEFKFGHRITARRNLLVNNWIAAQAGNSVLFSFTTNGPCAYCDMQDVLFEDNVILNGGYSVTGWIYDVTYKTGAGHSERATARNNYMALTPVATRPITISNVRGRHDFVFDRNTLVGGTTTAWLFGIFGNVWPAGDPAPTKGGPMQGLQFTNNVISRAGKYTTNAPEAKLHATGLAEFAPDGIVGGNVFGSVPAAADLAAMNAMARTYEPNVSVPEADLKAALPLDSCGTYGTKGADCARLAPVFAMLKDIPKDPPQPAPAPVAARRKTAAARTPAKK